MLLILIRHGRPESASPALVSLSQFKQISADYDDARLSEEGVRAISVLAKRLPKTLILSNDLPRARETAEIICGDSENVEFDPIFRELHSSRISAAWLDKLWAPPIIWALVCWVCWVLGIGERQEEPRSAWHRIAKAAGKILKRFETEENIILVSHGWFITLLAMQLRWHGLVERGPLIPQGSLGAATEYYLRPPAQ